MAKLEFLLKTTEHMCAAAAAGEFEQVARLKVERDALLYAVAGHRTPTAELRETLVRLLVLDREITGYVQQARDAAAAELDRLRAGQRARRAYAANGERDGWA